MGHFETFQRCLFAGVFESSRLLKHFDVDDFFKSNSLPKDTKLDLPRLSAYRGTPASIGLVLADALTGWHDPDKVNGYFNAFKLDYVLFSNEAKASLRILWQLRHSIVHTGAWLTIPDAQKVSDLRAFGNAPLVFEDTFIQAVCRKMHPLISDSTSKLHKNIIDKLSPEANTSDIEVINDLCKADSINTSWLK